MDEVRPGYYAVIPADVRYDDRIPANAKLLYGEISALIGSDGFCFASNQYFADIYGLTPVTVARLVSKLEDAGYIKRELEKDKTGQVVRRKIYLSVSVPDVQPLNNFDNTPQQNCGEGINKNVKDTNTSITNIEKENKKEKAAKPAQLSDDELRTLVTDCIQKVATERWTRDDKNTLYRLVMDLYDPAREVRKAHPMRTERSVNRTFRSLICWAGDSPKAMIDIVDRALANGWQGIQPPNGGGRGGSIYSSGADRQAEEVQYRCV